MTIDYRSMSVEERAEHKRMLEAAELADNARKDVAAAFAIRWAMTQLGEKAGQLKDIPAPAFPRAANLAKPADLSETEVSDIKKAVEKALSGI